MKVIERYASQVDKDWLWSLYKNLLMQSFDAQWGWDEGFQLQAFQKKLPIESFVIVSDHIGDVAAYCVSSHERHYYLKMLLVKGSQQGRGIGDYILTKLQGQAKEAGKSIKLSVIATNPVTGFYDKYGFIQDRIEDGSIHMYWHPQVGLL